MINLRLNTPDGRTSIVVDGAKTPKQILEENQIVTTGADISIDGIPVSVRDINTSFVDLGCGDTVVLSVVVKTGNAA